MILEALVFPSIRNKTKQTGTETIMILPHDTDTALDIYFFPYGDQRVPSFAMAWCQTPFESQPSQEMETKASQTRVTG